MRPFFSYVHLLAGCLLLGSFAFGMETALSPSTLYQRSDLWPPKASLTEDFSTSEGVVIPAKREAVLIRIEAGKGHPALLDFGRLGLHHVPINQTDCLERANEIAKGNVVKETPNWTMMISGGFYRLNPEAGGSGLSLNELEGARHFLIVYLDSDPGDMRATADLLDKHADLFKLTDTLPVVFGLDDFVRIGEPAYMKTLRANGLEDQIFVVPHISVPYATSMAHEIPGTPAITLIDTQGKTLYEPGSEESQIGEMFNDLKTVLGGLEHGSR